MKHSRINKYLAHLVAVLAASAVGGALMINVAAHSDMSNPVFEERHEFMTGLGKSMKAFSDYLKRGDGEPMELGAMAAAMAENAPNIPTLFPENTGMEQNEESEAKSNIWTEWEDFNAAANNLVGYAEALAAAFETGDKGAVGAAVKNLGGKGCRGCHSQFREKKD